MGHRQHDFPYNHGEGFDDNFITGEHEAFYTKTSSRRAFLLGAASVAGGLALEGKGALETLWWEHPDTTAHMVYVSRKLRESHVGLYTLPGFRVPNVRDGTNKMLPALMNNADYVAEVRYGNKGFDIEEIGEVIKDDCERRDIRIARFVGQSAGGIVATGLADYLAMYDIVTDRITMLSTPTDIDDIRPGSKFVVDNANEDMELGVRLVAETAYSISQGSSFGETMDAVSRDECSNKQLAGLAKYIREYELTEALANLPIRTSLIHIGASGDIDSHVDIQRAQQRLKKAGREQGRTVLCYQTEEVKHADISESASEFTRLLNAATPILDERDRLLGLQYPRRGVGGI